MNHDLTISDIKESIDYKCYKKYFWVFLIFWLFTTSLFFLAMSLPFSDDLDLFLENLGYILILPTFSSLIFMPFFIPSGYKMRYLLKNYQNFKLYEVKLDNISVGLRGQVSYYVTFVHEGKRKNISTNACFSGVMSDFTVEEYNNKKVLVLYDDKKEKVYVIRKAKESY